MHHTRLERGLWLTLEGCDPANFSDLPGKQLFQPGSLPLWKRFSAWEQTKPGCTAPLEDSVSTSLLQSNRVKCVLLPDAFLDQPLWFELFRKTAGQRLPLPVNEGIIWKQSSQYSGLMSIYLQGVCSFPPSYLSKHIWCPVVEASKRSVCFPVDACSLFMQICALVVRLWAVWEKQMSCFELLLEMSACIDRCFDVCRFQPRWQNQDTSPIKSISILPNQVPTPSPRASDGEDSS